MRVEPIAGLSVGVVAFDVRADGAVVSARRHRGGCVVDMFGREWALRVDPDEPVIVRWWRDDAVAVILLLREDGPNILRLGFDGAVDTYRVPERVSTAAVVDGRLYCAYGEEAQAPEIVVLGSGGISGTIRVPGVRGLEAICGTEDAALYFASTTPPTVIGRLDLGTSAPNDPSWVIVSPWTGIDDPSDHILSALVAKGGQMWVHDYGSGAISQVDLANGTTKQVGWWDHYAWTGSRQEFLSLDRGGRPVRIVPPL
jgi:hypothetical protein